VGDTMLTDGTKNVIAAMKAKGIKRLAVVTSIGKLLHLLVVQLECCPLQWTLNAFALQAREIVRVKRLSSLRYSCGLQ
jgi:hypothetical protein